MADRTLVVKTETDVFTLRGRPCELSAFSFICKDRRLPKERTYFNAERKEHYPMRVYDKVFQDSYNYNNKLHRDDREHAKLRGLTVYEEEKVRTVPILSSSTYGKKLHIHVDHPEKKHGRIAYVSTEFFRRNGAFSY